MIDFHFVRTIALLLDLPAAAQAQLTIPNADGSDGPFNPTNNAIINLGLATTAPWGTPGSGNGVTIPSSGRRNERANAVV